MFSWTTGLFALLLGSDVLIKQYVEENIEPGEKREVFDGKVIIRKVYNKGFLLNFLDRYPAIIKGTSIAAGVGVLIYDALFFWKRGRYIEKLGTTFITAGAASNIFDRLARGKVIDYIAFRSSNKSLARITANLGDFYIAVGALLTLIGNAHRRSP